MKSRFVIAALVAALLAVPTTVRADVKPHALIGDGMVLQQGVPCKVWGTADPGEQVKVDVSRGRNRRRRRSAVPRTRTASGR